MIGNAATGWQQPQELRDNIVIKVHETKTVDLVETAMQKASAHPQYAEKWIVFDRDRVPRFDEIIERAEECGVHAGWSNPCIEIWFFAYWNKMPNTYESKQLWKDFAFEYKRRTGQEYDKADDTIYQRLCKTGDEAVAIECAKRNHRNFLRDRKTPVEMCPCSTLYELVEEISVKTKPGR